MAQDVQVAGLGSPIVPQGPGQTEALLGVAGDAAQRFRQQSLEGRTQRVAEDAANIADANRNLLENANQAEGGGIFGGGQGSPSESAALLESAEGLSAEDILSSRQREVSDEANRVFGRYRRALGQGATNASATRIAVEKEMQDMISSNPAFADTIRQAAAQSMGQTEFRLLTQDRPQAPGGSGGATSQFQKDWASVNDALDQMGQLNGWSENQTNYRKQQAMQDLSSRYLSENRNDMFSAEAEGSEYASRVKLNTLRENVNRKANEVLTTGLDLMQETGQEFLSEENVAQFRRTLAQQEQEFRREAEEMIPPNVSSEQRNAMIGEALAPFRNVMGTLESGRASEVLQGYQTAMDAGMKLEMGRMLPFVTAMSDTFGQNYSYVANMFEEGRLNELAFQNSGMIGDLQDLVESGDITREQLPGMISGRINRAVNSAVSGEENVNWQAVSAGYAGPMGGRVPKENRNQDQKYGDVTERMAYESPREAAKVIVGTPDLDKYQANVVNRFDQAVADRANALRRRVSGRSQPSEGRDVYVLPTQGSDGRLTFNEYTAVLGTDPDSGEDVWRVQGVREVQDLSTAVGFMTNQYGVGNGRRRSIVTHPQLSGRFGESEEEYVNGLVDRINGDRDVPEWLRDRQRASSVRGEDIADSTLGGLARALGAPTIQSPTIPISTLLDAGTALPRAAAGALGSLVGEGSEGTQRRRQEATERLEGSRASEVRTMRLPRQGSSDPQQDQPQSPDDITVDRVRDAVQRYNRGEQLSGADRMLAGVATTPNPEDFGMSEERWAMMPEEDRYRLIADTVRRRMAE